MSSSVLIEDRPGHAPHRLIPASSHSHSAILIRFWQAINGTLKTFAEGAAAARRAARAYDQLTAMSEPELHDIGLHRSDIPAVVSGTYRETRWSSLEGSDCRRDEPMLRLDMGA